MLVFGNIAHTMILDKKRGKLDVKGTKCLFLEYFKGMKAYRLMCSEKNEIIKNKGVVYMKDSENIMNDLKMRLSGRIEGHMLVVMDKSSKSPWFDGGGQFVDGNEQ